MGSRFVILSVSRFAACWGLVWIGWCSANLLRAEERRITVTGAGVTSAQPDVVEITGKLSSTAKLVEDALAKYQGNRRRLMEAMEKLQMPQLTIHSSGVQIGSRFGPLGDGNPFGNGPREKPKTAADVRVSETITFRMENIGALPADQLFERLSKIIEAGSDAGLAMSNQASPQVMMMMSQTGEGFEASLARFHIRDRQQAISAAYSQAMQDARTRAARLAELSDANLGRVVTVGEESIQAVDETDDLESTVKRMYGYGDYSEQTGQPFQTNRFGKMRIEARLNVTFELQPKE